MDSGGDSMMASAARCACHCFSNVIGGHPKGCSYEFIGTT